MVSKDQAGMAVRFWENPFFHSHDISIFSPPHAILNDQLFHNDYTARVSQILFDGKERLDWDDFPRRRDTTITGMLYEVGL